MTSLRRDVIARLYIGRLGNARANLTPNKPLGGIPPAAQRLNNGAIALDLVHEDAIDEP